MSMATVSVTLPQARQAVPVKARHDNCTTAPHVLRLTDVFGGRGDRSWWVRMSGSLRTSGPASPFFQKPGFRRIGIARDEPASGIELFGGSTEPAQSRDLAILSLSSRGATAAGEVRFETGERATWVAQRGELQAGERHQRRTAALGAW